MASPWPNGLVQQTRYILEETPLVGFAFRRGCDLKHVDGRKGYMLLRDALDRRYYVQLKEGPGEHFNTIDELLDAGWVVVL